MGDERSTSADPFLREKVKAGNFTLGGLDDQIGAGTYASRQMSSDLVRSLPGDEKSHCLAILNRHMLWQYTKDAPYSPAGKTKIVGCLNQIEARLPPPGKSDAARPEEDRAMIDSLKRHFARDFTLDLTKNDQAVMWKNARDHSMYLNFQWLQSRLPPHSKVIVWAATVHLAKDLSGVSGDGGSLPLGSYIRRDFGDQAFTLGFSAYSGTYVVVRPPVRPLSAAPDNSLEAQSFADLDANTVYLNVKQLRKLGSVPARPLGTDFKTARWDEVLDGLVVFREERAPKYLDR